MKAVRKSLLPLALVCTVLMAAETVQAADAVTWQTNVEQAALQSQQTGKPMLVDVTASWCGFCKKMKATTYADPQVAAAISAGYIPVTIDADANKELVKQIGVEGLPTTLIVAHDMEVLEKITGFRDAKAMGAELAKHTPAAQQPLAPQNSFVRDEVPNTPVRPVSMANEPVAFNGYCLVSMLDDRSIVAGDDSISTSYRGYRLTFATPQHKQTFEANPERYWPVLDGYCAVSAIERGQRAQGDAEWIAIYRNKLWVFATNTERLQFARTPAKYADEVLR